MTVVPIVCKLLLLAFLITEVQLDHQHWRNFRCSDGDYIPSSSFCDGRNDCEDGIDESIGCDKTNCGSGKFKCGDGSCLNITIRCNSFNDCNDGSDELNCVSHENVLLYVTSQQIKMFNFTSNHSSYLMPNSFYLEGLAAAHNRYYFMSLIPRSLVDAGIHTNQFDSIGVDLPRVNSIAVDWITESVYLATSKAIYVCKTNIGMIGTKLKDCNKCLIALAPRYGWMFWSNKTDIMRSNMDGSNDTIFLKDAFARPYSLSITESTDGVYWFDTERGALFFKDFFGKDPVERVRNLTVNGIVDAYAVFDDIIFTTGDEIYRPKGINMNDGSVRYVINDIFNPIQYLHAYNPLLQKTKIANPCTKESCDGLCLLRPGSSPKTLNYTCECTKWSYNNFEPLVWCEKQTATSTSSGMLPWILIILLVIVILCSAFIYYIFRKNKSQRNKGKEYQLGQST